MLYRRSQCADCRFHKCAGLFVHAEIAGAVEVLGARVRAALEAVLYRRRTAGARLRAWLPQVK